MLVTAYVLQRKEIINAIKEPSDSDCEWDSDEEDEDDEAGDGDEDETKVGGTERIFSNSVI